MGKRKSDIARPDPIRPVWQRTVSCHIEQIYNSLDPLQQEEIRKETENRLPDF